MRRFVAQVDIHLHLAILSREAAAIPLTQCVSAGGMGSTQARFSGRHCRTVAKWRARIASLDSAL